MLQDISASDEGVLIVAIAQGLPGNNPKSGYSVGVSNASNLCPPFYPNPSSHQNQAA